MEPPQETETSPVTYDTTLRYVGNLFSSDVLEMVLSIYKYPKFVFLGSFL